MKKILFFLFFLSIISAFVVVIDLPFNLPKGWPPAKYNFSNKHYTKEKILIGRLLFYDPLLSKNNTISCASCHSPYNAFAHSDHALSHGIYDSIGTRNAPALFNLAWQASFMWDGSIQKLDDQAVIPITHPKEMGAEMNGVLDKLNNQPMYRKLFASAYGDSVITKKHMLESITQFLLTLVSDQSKYDSVSRHQAIFTLQEKNGYRLYKKNCAVCHQEPLFTSTGFKKNGLPYNPHLHDFGRYNVTGKVLDSFAFKVPSLRNLQYSSPYMHDGRFTKLSEVVNHYANNLSANKYLSKELKNAIILNSNERVDLVAFLLTLSDKKFLFNPDYSFPKELLPNH